MRLALISAAAILASAPAFAEDAGAPAAPSGAPAAAAQKGSSMSGVAGSKDEMSSHMQNAKKQQEQANPHKQAQ